MCDSAQQRFEEKLAFSHVWEDPTSESSIINSIRSSTKNKIKILMVCSGGDTLIHLLCNNDLDNIEIDAIDNNRLQISACVFKLLLSHYLHGDHLKYIDIMNGNNNKTDDMKKLLHELI